MSGKRLSWWGMAGIVCGVSGALVGWKANAQTFAVVGATVALGDGSQPIQNGMVVVRNGRIVAAGDIRMKLPADTQVIDARGKWVTPGIVAGFSRLGLTEVDLSAQGADDSSADGPFNAALDVVPAINPLHSTIAVNRADGVTRALVAPNAGKSIFAGQGAVIDTGADRDPITAARKFQFVELGETGSALVSHRGIDKISMTGSPEVGEKIYAAAASGIKRLSLELGGKSAGIVFPDARSVRAAATTLMGLCSTFLSGQVCSTPSRAIVHASIVDEFVEHAHEQVQNVRFGDPFDPATTSAPMISKRQVDKVLGFVESGQKEGARLVFGGDRPGGDLARGNWVNPALFINATNQMRVAREEIFGPVLTVIPFETEAEAIAIANDSEYGLAGAIYTTDISRAFRVARAVRSGSIGINNYASVPNAPMGGVKRSGVGREGGWQTIEAFTELKTININLDA